MEEQKYFRDPGHKSNRPRCSNTRLMAIVGLLIGLAIIAAISVGTTLAFKSDTSQASIKVAAFNIKSFGVSKMSKPDVVNNIVNILERYDLVLIQEVRDMRESSLRDLENLLDQGDSWAYISSNPIGRTSYREQYVFFYRTDKVQVVGQYQHNDTANDYFEREPFAINIKYYSTSKSESREMALLGLHTTPRDAVRELMLLPGVMKTVSETFSCADGVIAMGDFNADCRFVSSSELKSLDIFNGNGFTSYIGHGVDTTTSHNTHCAYDRIISSGNVQISSARVFNFEPALGLNESTARDISDHYPVEFILN